MSTNDDLDNFRLAQSYLDKARKERAHWLQVLDARVARLSHYDTIKATYDAHVRNAEQFVEEFRATFERRREPTARKLKDANSRLRKFHKSVDAGKLGAKKANALNRTIRDEILQLTSDLNCIEQVCSADAAIDVGGFEDLPLDEYRPKLDKLRERPTRKLSEIELSTVQTVIGFAVLGLVIGVFYYFVYLAPSVAFSAVAAGDDGHIIKIVCQNTGRGTIGVYAPWPDGVPQAPPGDSAPRAAFGVQVFVIEKGYDNLKLLSDSSGAWFQRGSPIPPDTPILVSPGRAVTFAMNANKLTASGLNVSALRVVFVRTGGKELGHFDLFLEDTA